MWLEKLSDNYTGVAFIYYNTGYKEIVDVNINTPMQDIEKI